MYKKKLNHFKFKLTHNVSNLTGSIPRQINMLQSAIIKKMADVDFTNMHCGLKSFKKVN